MSTRKAPAGLEKPGRHLWDAVTGKWELRPDELRVLEDACREADLVDVLEQGMKGADLLVRGSQGQQVINPLISELRQHRATVASLLRQLKLPDESASDSGGELSAKNRAAANARWARRGA